MTVLPFPVAVDLNAREEACLLSGQVLGGGGGSSGSSLLSKGGLSL